MKINTILFGLGPHAKRIYLKYVSQQQNFGKLVVVDLKNRENELRDILEHTRIDYELILFDARCRNSERLTREQRQILSSVINAYNIEKAIISTEPRSHLVYLNYCLDMGLDIICDKPITSPLYTHSEYGANKIEEGKCQIIGCKSSKLNFCLYFKAHPELMRSKMYLVK